MWRLTIPLLLSWLDFTVISALLGFFSFFDPSIWTSILDYSLSFLYFFLLVTLILASESDLNTLVMSPNGHISNVNDTYWMKLYRYLYRMTHTENNCSWFWSVPTILWLCVHSSPFLKRGKGSWPPCINFLHLLSSQIFFSEPDYLIKDENFRHWF